MFHMKHFSFEILAKPCIICIMPIKYGAGGAKKSKKKSKYIEDSVTTKRRKNLNGAMKDIALVKKKKVKAKKE